MHETVPTAEPTVSSPMMELLARHPHAVVLACFFLSGATGLVYEVLWSRRLTLINGGRIALQNPGIPGLSMYTAGVEGLWA